LSPELVADLKLALTEACSNSVRHAYDEGREGAVEIRYELSGDRLTVEVADEGSGFDPEVLERAQEELDEGGLGIAIIRAVTDNLEIGVRAEGGSRLRFTKYLT
jgi:serine/threonine-protein kinase RsbW